MSLGKFLKKLRKDAGMSQQEVAQKLGMARATYASLEVDRREPDLGEIKAIADLYEISMMEIIAEEADNWPDFVSEPTVKYGSHKEPVQPASGAGQQENSKKLREILLYISGEIGAKPNVGESVIEKLLYFIDSEYLKKHQQSITGLSYVHSRFGPTPAKSFVELVSQMESCGELEIVSTKHFNNTQKKYLPLRQPDLQELSAKEYLHINETLALLGDNTAEQLNELYADTNQGIA